MFAFELPHPHSSPVQIVFEAIPDLVNHCDVRGAVCVCVCVVLCVEPGPGGPMSLGEWIVRGSRACVNERVRWCGSEWEWEWMSECVPVGARSNLHFLHQALHQHHWTR